MYKEIRERRTTVLDYITRQKKSVNRKELIGEEKKRKKKGIINPGGVATTRTRHENTYQTPS
jgi:hypothetical protein